MEVLELEGEEGGFRLLVLGAGRQDVIRTLGGFGHGDVDHHRELERLEGLTPALVYSECTDSTIDERSAQPVGMVVRISSGMPLHGISPPRMRWLPTGVATVATATSACEFRTQEGSSTFTPKLP